MTAAVARQEPLFRARVRAGARILVGLIVAGACTSAPPAPSSASSTASTRPQAAVAIPAEQLPPEKKCLVDHGFKLVAVLPPQVEGDEPGYKWEMDDPIDPAEDARRMAIIEECEKLGPKRPEKTDADIRVIYDRWLGERMCLIELGYEPDTPPSFETFLSTWKTTGPWSPLDGVDTNAWSAADYETAKKKCTLEFFNRE